MWDTHEYSQLNLSLTSASASWVWFDSDEKSLPWPIVGYGILLGAPEYLPLKLMGVPDVHPGYLRVSRNICL